MKHLVTKEMDITFHLQYNFMFLEMIYAFKYNVYISLTYGDHFLGRIIGK